MLQLLTQMCAMPHKVSSILYAFKVDISYIMAMNVGVMAKISSKLCLKEKKIEHKRNH